MSASNYNWVCFKCRISQRQPKTSVRVPACLECGKDCFCLGYKVEIPRRDSVRAWKALQNECRKRLLHEEDGIAAARVRYKHYREKEIERLESLEPSNERDRLIKKLKDSLSGGS